MSYKLLCILTPRASKWMIPREGGNRCSWPLPSKGRKLSQIVIVFFQLQKKQNIIYEFEINHCVPGLILDPAI